MRGVLLKRIYVLILLFLSTLLVVYPSDAESRKDSLYGAISPADYVSGRFNAARSPLFVKLQSLGIPCNNRDHYLRREAAAALKRMIDAFKAEHPGIPVWVTSSTRSYYDQRYIWESKWYGRRLVGGRRLDRQVKAPLERGRIILEFSSMPGTSRHHWGTEVDLNVLTNGYYITGKGKVLYHWLRDNAARYGFCQPYSKGRKKGYSEEMWHWSYLPLAKQFLHDWNRMVTSEMVFSKGEPFAGASVLWHLAPEYVNSINGDCR